MFGQKQSAPAEQSLLAREGRFIAHLNREAYNWLGSRYAWYNKIRNAKKGSLPLLHDRSLEEQMEATRSALSLVGKTLNTGLMLAYNSVIDGVKNAGAAPEDWPEKIGSADRGSAPKLTEEQDAVIVGWMPLKFLNLAKSVRDKGKGLDFYVDGLVKKLTFKIIGYYCEPQHWDASRLGYFLSGLAADASLQEVQGRLSMLKTEVDMLASTYQMFRFGRQRGRQDPANKNALEETFEISDQELLNDLYFQSFLISGVEHFVFRYYLTLLSATDNVRALKQISQIFEPLLAKTEEVHLRFQASFAMEKEKLRLRQEYMAYVKEMEARPPVETVQEKGREVRRINYTMRRLENVAFPRSGQFSQRHTENWQSYLGEELIKRNEAERGFHLLLEVVNTLVLSTQNSMDGKLKVAQAMRTFADEQERLGRAQIAQKKRLFEENRRKKMREAAKFKAQEQPQMVEIIHKEVAESEARNEEELEQLEQAIVKRREAQIARVEQLEQAARQDRERNLGKNAAVVYRIALELDTERKIRSGFVPMLVNHVQQDKDTHHDLLYRNLFTALPGLFPTEKMVLRTAIANKLELQPNELEISDEEMASYQQQLDLRKAELNQEVPGVLDQKLVQGPVVLRVEDLLNMGLTHGSLRLLLQLPFAAPNKPGAKLPAPVVRKLLMINQLTHPMAQHDILLPNVEETAPPMKRVNFNRLQKLMA